MINGEENEVVEPASTPIDTTTTSRSSEKEADKSAESIDSNETTKTSTNEENDLDKNVEKAASAEAIESSLVEPTTKEDTAENEIEREHADSGKSFFKIQITIHVNNFLLNYFTLFVIRFEKV